MIRTIFATLLLSFAASLFAAPDNFSASKVELKRHVYYDQNSLGTLYCGCNWQWVGSSGGIIDHKSCGYQIASQPDRARRLEWEHIMPASNFGRARQCWQHGGRQNCTATDPVFNRMEADMFNLAPSIGEVNADRSNFNYGQLNSSSRKYGACDFKVDFRSRTAEPRNEIKGRVARVYFYMADRYGITLSRQQQQLFVAWNKLYPVTEEERMLESRTAARMGHNNQFVTGEKKWELGRIAGGDGRVSSAAPAPAPQAHLTELNVALSSYVRGNKRSGIYHMPAGCPSYNQISQNNIVVFKSESEAISAGFRKAGNCR